METERYSSRNTTLIWFFLNVVLEEEVYLEFVLVIHIINLLRFFPDVDSSWLV